MYNETMINIQLDLMAQNELDFQLHCEQEYWIETLGYDPGFWN